MDPSNSLKLYTRLTVAGVITVLVGLCAEILLVYSSLRSISHGDLHSPQSNHTALLLKDGRVLILDGDSAKRMDVFDPLTLRWTESGSEPDFLGYTACVLNDGKVFRDGSPGGERYMTFYTPTDPGTTYDGKPIKPKLYNPVTEKWSDARRESPLNEFIARFPQCEVLDSGPTVINSGSGKSTTLVDLNTGNWARLPLPEVQNYEMFQCHSYRVKQKILWLGFDLIAITSRAEIFDLTTLKWSKTEAPYFALDFTHVTLPDGRFMMSGGSYDRTELASSEVYDSDTGKWTLLPNLAQARGKAQAVVLKNGSVLVIGGGGLWEELPTTSCELFDGKAWRSTGSLKVPRGGHSATLLQDGKVLVAGGTRGMETYTWFGQKEFSNQYLTECEIYDPATGQWTRL